MREAQDHSEQCVAVLNDHGCSTFAILWKRKEMGFHFYNKKDNKIVVF